MRRLARGERWWMAEIVVRGIGALLLALCAGAAATLHRTLGPSSPRDAGVADCALAALAVLCWGLGWAFAVEGPGLFRHIPVPGRHGIL